MSALAVVGKPPDRIARDPYTVRKFSVTEYHRMMEAGVLTANDRVELLEGWIINKMPQNPPHRSSVGRIVRRIAKILPDDWVMSVQGPVTLSDSESEPDITLARGEEGTYDARHPEPADIGILMEVGDSSVLADRRYKGELYAQAKVAEFWLVNLVERKIEVYTKPRSGKYRKTIEYAEGEQIPLVLDGVKIAVIPVSELIPQS